MLRRNTTLLQRSTLPRCSMIVLLCSMTPLAARADDPPEPDDEMGVVGAEVPDESFAATPVEREGLLAAATSKWIKAREIGEKLVRESPGRFSGHYLLGAALHYGEGDLARAEFELQLATRLYEAQYPRPAGGTRGGPWRWHQTALQELSWTLSEMDRSEEVLAVIDRYNDEYTPKLNDDRIWPLMKLHRYQEARAAATMAIASGIHEQALHARANLCSIAYVENDRKKAYDLCVAALDDYKLSRLMGGQIEYENASEAAIALLRFDEGERLLVEATERVSHDSASNPFVELARLYLTEGRVPEALAALRQAQELRIARPAYLDQHGQARLDKTVASLLLLVGEHARALTLAARGAARPDRLGTISTYPDEEESGAEVLRATALAEQAAREEEDAVTSPFVKSVALHLAAMQHRVEAWRARRAAAVLFGRAELLTATLDAYAAGASDLPSWLMPEVVRAVGSGVAVAALGGVSEYPQQPGMASYLDTFRAEAAFANHDFPAANEAAARAFKSLPDAERLLRARVAAITAESLRQDGHAHEAAGSYAVVFARDPDVLRRLDVPLPVAIEDDGSEIARAAHTLVGRSPRFVDDASSGLRVTLHCSNDQAQACLHGAQGEQVACAEVAIHDGVKPLDVARTLIAELHRVAFACKSDLSQADLSTLDGSPTAARNERQVKSLLDDLGPEKDRR